MSAGAPTSVDSLKLRQIDDEMRDMLMMANDTRSAIREMNEAFEGDQEVEYIAEQVNDRLKVHK